MGRVLRAAGLLPLLLTVATASASWTIETVDSQGDVGHYASIGLDATGRPVIAYHDALTGDCKLARRDTPGWTHQTLVHDDGFPNGYGADLALAPDGRIHVSHVAEWGGRARCVYQTDGGWEKATMFGQADSFDPWTSVAVDDQMAYFVAYSRDLLLESLYLFQKGAGQWEGQTVLEVGHVEHPCLELDPLGRLCLSYHDPTAGSLRFARRSGGSWEVETLQEGADVGEYSSLVFDGADRRYISYYDRTEGNLMCLIRSGEQEQAVVVDSPRDVGSFSSAAIHPDGLGRIAYYDATAGDLKFAQERELSWVTFRIDQEGDVGRYSSQTLDPAGYAHIAYYDASKGDLRYATDMPPGAGLIVDLELSTSHPTPGDSFGVTAGIDNIGPYLAETSLFCLLDIHGAYYFYPTWVEYPPGVDWTQETLEEGVRLDVTILPAFQWPEIEGADQGLYFHAACVDQAAGIILGRMDSEEWSFGA